MFCLVTDIMTHCFLTLFLRIDKLKKLQSLKQESLSQSSYTSMHASSKALLIKGGHEATAINQLVYHNIKPHIL